MTLTAFVLTLAAVGGFYRPLADRALRLAIAGALLGAGAGLMTFATLLWVVSAALADQPMPPGSTVALVVIGSLLALFVFGIASVRIDVPSRERGVLLLTLAAAWGMWVGTGLLVVRPEWTANAIGGRFSGITSAVGYVRHTGTTSLDEKAQSSTPATR